MSPCVVEFVLSDSVGPSFERDDLLLGERAHRCLSSLSLGYGCPFRMAHVVLLGHPVENPTTFVVHRLLPIIQAFQLKQRRLNALLKVGTFGL